MPDLLPSGLAEVIADPEPLSRFLNQSNRFKREIVKPAAFLPHPMHRNTSVFRVGIDPPRWLEIYASVTTRADLPLKAVAVVEAGHVRGCGLDVIADEGPPGHANIERWPWLQDDPDELKARHKLIAAEIAKQSKAYPLANQ